MNCKCCFCKAEKSKFKAYKLRKSMPGLKAGIVFIHDKEDNKKGSIGHGCLKNAWVDGNCQSSGDHAWCAETHVLPGQLAEDEEWFTEIENDGTYHL